VVPASAPPAPPAVVNGPATTAGQPAAIEEPGLLDSLLENPLCLLRRQA
jgi:hypothetical protein